MGSGYATWWKRILLKVPFLFKKCPDGNYHWRFDLYCICRMNEHDGSWHGGTYCFKHGQATPCLKTWVDKP